MKYGLTVCCVGDLNLETVISDLYNRVWNGIRFELHWGWADCRFLKRKRYNFLFSWERRMDWFRYLTGFLSKSSYLVIKVACMDMMFLTPAFIRKTGGLFIAYNMSVFIRVFYSIIQDIIQRFGCPFGIMIRFKVFWIIKSYLNVLLISR